MDCNIFEMSQEEKNARKIEEIPGTLLEAIEALEQDSLMKEILGEHVYHKYSEAKKEEWQSYRSQVTEWEIARYLNRY